MPEMLNVALQTISDRLKALEKIEVWNVELHFELNDRQMQIKTR